MAKNLNSDIAIRFTGLRPSEKLLEELILSDNDQPTDYPLVLKTKEQRLEAKNSPSYALNLIGVLMPGIAKKLLVLYMGWSRNINKS